MQNINLVVRSLGQKILGNKSVKEKMSVSHFAVNADFVAENSVSVYCRPFYKSSIFKFVSLTEQSPVVGNGITKSEFTTVKKKFL